MRKKNILILIAVLCILYSILIMWSSKYYPSLFNVLLFPVLKLPTYILIPLLFVSFLVAMYESYRDIGSNEELKAKYTELKKQDYDYVFCKLGDKWKVTFEGKVCYFNNRVGISYIVQLLARPHRPIPSLQLVKQQGDTKLLNQSKVVDDGDVSTDLNESQDLVDENTLRECKKRLRGIDQELEEAEKNNDQATKERLEEEKRTVCEYIGKTTKPSGESASFPNATEKARKAVSKAINNALNNIQKHNASLYQHLSNSISTGTNCIYTPENEVDWHL